MERDEETGLNYHSARYYAPWLGRWAKCDPLALADGINLYVYVGSNPNVLVDPLGTDGHSPEWRAYAQASRELQAADARLAEFKKSKEYAALERLEAAKAKFRQLGTELSEKVKQHAAARTDYAVKQERAEEAKERAKESAIKAEKSAKSYRRWRVAAIVGTVVAVALSAGTLAYPAFVGTTTAAAGTATTAGAGTLSTTIATSTTVARGVQVVAGAGGAGVLLNEAQESVPLIGEAAPAIQTAVSEGEAAASTLETTAASVADKLQRYLLEPTHPDGGSKAKWFADALGFTQKNAPELAKQIIFDPAKAIATELTQHGQKFEQFISIAGANSRTIDVLFVWIRNNDAVVRLITAIPTKK